MANISSTFTATDFPAVRKMYVGLILSVLIILLILPAGLKTQHSGYLINKAFHEEFCFDFPSNWETNGGKPGDATVDLNGCLDREAIQINKAEFIRPDDRGDECGTTRTCCSATDDDCEVDIEMEYSTLYQSIKNNCDGQQGCYIRVPALKTDSVCGHWYSRCDTKPGSRLNVGKSCFARRIKIYYACRPQLEPVPKPITTTEHVTMVTKRPSVTTQSVSDGPFPSQRPGADSGPGTESMSVSKNQSGEKNIGLMVGVTLAALILLVIVVIVIVVFVFRRRNRNHRKAEKYPPPQTSNNNTEDPPEPEYANQVSGWDEPPVDNEEDNSLLENKEDPNDTYSRVKGTPTSIDYMLMTNVKSKKKQNKPTEPDVLVNMATEKPDSAATEETNLNAEGAATVVTGGGEMDYIRCDSVDMNMDRWGDTEENGEERMYYNQMDVSGHHRSTSAQDLLVNNAVYEKDQRGEEEGVVGESSESVYEKEQEVVVVTGVNKGKEEEGEGHYDVVETEQKKNAEEDGEDGEDGGKVNLEGSGEIGRERLDSPSHQHDKATGEGYYGNVYGHIASEGKQREA